MGNGEFKKVTQSEKLLYGPRKLLICGFSSAEQPEFINLLKSLGLTDLPLVWVTEDKENMLLGELFELEDKTGEKISSSLSRAVIMAGIKEKELHQIMTGYRQSTNMIRPLYATLTPVSETWTIKNLLTELSMEHEAMHKKNQ